VTNDGTQNTNDVGDLSGLVAVVTGAAAGLGRAEAIGLARQGATVVVNDIDEARLSATVADVVRAGDDGAAVDEQLGDVLVAAEVLAVAVGEDHDPARVVVGPHGERDLRLAARERLDLRLAAHGCSSFVVGSVTSRHAAPAGNANSASDSGRISMLYPGASGTT
jgi:3-oxoacyl-[acyl-carrier protein] reductase